MFKAINYLIFDKNKIELDNEVLSEFSPYMTSRYLSFYDKMWGEYTNETLNIYSNIFNTTEDQFKFYDAVIPKLKKKKIQYVKRPKIKDDEKEVSIPEFYSKREMKYIETRRSQIACG